MSTEEGSRPEIPHPSVAEWKQIVTPYEEPSVWRATWQIVDTLGPYLLLWVLMYYSLAVSWWLTLPLAALASMPFLTGMTHLEGRSSHDLDPGGGTFFSPA